MNDLDEPEFGEATVYRTKTGRVLTDADIEALADEAEKGYSLDRISRVIDVESPAARALRALQKLDALDSINNRQLLLEAEDHLGRLLGLTCSGVQEDREAIGLRTYDHSGDTCPIHEWLVRDDCPDV